jgi:hypothetical protein
MMQFSVWEFPGDRTIHLVLGPLPVASEEGRRLLSGARKALEFEADGWEEAEAIAYAHYGVAIEPWRASYFILPMPGAEQ